MPDTRRHRGPHPEDAALFAPAARPALNAAVRDLSWLLSRGYAPPSSLKLVGDRYRLTARQRMAVTRCACTDDALRGRRQREAPLESASAQRLLVDGYNVLTTVETALGGGIILHARDGTFRDIAGIHGTYRTVEETAPAVERVGDVLRDAGVGHCVWYLDGPVSNSGRLKQALLDVARGRGWPWDVEVVADPDRMLAGAADAVASADSQILDSCPHWTNLARRVVERCPEARVIEMTGSES